MGKIKVGVLASGRGSDFQSIIDGVESGRVNADIAVLISDNPLAKALDRAKEHKIPAICINPNDYLSREEHDKAIRKKLEEFKVELVVLAGYMRLIKDKKFLQDYRGRMINIHPALLPSFPGAHAQRDAFNYGAKVSGYTIHFVDENPDGGPVIYQEAVDISDCKTEDEVAAKILKREHVGLPIIVDSFSKGKYVIEGRRVRYTPTSP
ncbi:MAG: Phosphoribosylglycinamide formyltransferase [Candidatus Fermentimicrarchaeum limneticum]|uniref:phosphoribosylglycinamide formyltransferase 1 n=1 Tax=Fermentimicrarchaeum limneticum TaxID=2795018 RepID=A0A7D6BPB8_FERL1|nr:MAG: Phosphoribosylglycinamide formyltransferase [Candidatus Fermentimicrarchaeum limneticum]